MAISPTQKLHEEKLIHTVLKIIHKLILLTLPYAILCYILIPIYCFDDMVPNQHSISQSFLAFRINDIIPKTSTKH